MLLGSIGGDDIDHVAGRPASRSGDLFAVGGRVDALRMGRRVGRAWKSIGSGEEEGVKFEGGLVVLGERVSSEGWGEEARGGLARRCRVIVGVTDGKTRL